MAVDTSDYHFIIKYLEKNNLELTHILTTHKHWDHSGANEQLAKKFKNLLVYGSKGDQIIAMNKPVGEGDEFKIGDNINVSVIESPCHTSGHILFYVKIQNVSDPILFTGDTLFIGGCGKFFEGTAKMMYENFEKIRKLPKNTQIYCGHEYANTLLTFGLEVEPDNEKLRDKLLQVREDRKKGIPSVPSTIQSEEETNVFFRCSNEALMKIYKESDPIKILNTLRDEKNNWKMKK